MLSKTIRRAAINGKYNEFDLETWAHEAKALEEDLGLAEYRQEEQFKRAAKYYAENVELRKALTNGGKYTWYHFENWANDIENRQRHQSILTEWLFSISVLVKALEVGDAKVTGTGGTDA